MPHKPSPAKRLRDRPRWEQHKQRQGQYIRRDHELISIKESRFFVQGEIVEAPRFLSPAYIPWTQSQLRYEYYRKKEQDQKSMADRLREQ